MGLVLKTGETYTVDTGETYTSDSGIYARVTNLSWDKDQRFSFTLCVYASKEMADIGKNTLSDSIFALTIRENIQDIFTVDKQLFLDEITAFPSDQISKLKILIAAIYDYIATLSNINNFIPSDWEADS